MDSEKKSDQPVESAAEVSSADAGGETPEERRARMMAEIKAKAAARMAAKGGAATVSDTQSPSAPPSVSNAASATPPATLTDSPAGETPEEKRARIIAEAKAKAAAKMAAAKGNANAASAPPVEATSAPTPTLTAAAEIADASRQEVPAGTPPAARVAPGAAKTTVTPTASVVKGVPAPVAAKQQPTTIDTIPEPPINKMRRRIIWASIIGVVGTITAGILRFFLPRTIFEPSSVFRVGFPGDYGIGVDTKYQQLYRVWVVKTSDRLFVINAVCTHLGCTPDWKASENKFKCPCHGSGYDSEGINFEGPAPRPMDRAHIELDAEGQIVVNKGRLYEWPKGGENRFNEEGAYVPLGG